MIDNTTPDLFDEKQPTETAPEVASDAGHATESEASPAKMSVKEAISAAVTEVRARDEKGRFARGDEAPEPKSKPEKADAPAPEAVEPTHSADPKGEPSHSAPPTSWTKESKALWESLPAAVKAEVYRREADTTKGVQQLKQRYGAIDQVLAPHIQAFRQAGREPHDVIQQLIGWNYALANPDKGKAREAFQRLAAAFQIDPSTIGSASPGSNGAIPSAQVPPELYARVNQLSTVVSQQQQLHQQQQAAAAEQSIQNWAKDKPHFVKVREHMGHLINADLTALHQTGVAPGGFVKNGNVDLDAVYNAAVYANSETRAAMLSEEAAKKSAAQKAAVEKARAAGVSLRTGTPAPQAANGKADPKRNMSIKESIKAAYAEVRSR